ncbi:nucleoside-triphosphatase [Chloroflexota bacterium]
MMMIITGEREIGKSTICKQVEELAHKEWLTCGGIITYKSSDSGIVIKDMQTGRTESLASIENKYKGSYSGKYYFNPAGIQFGLEAIQKGISADILFVDELGHLELKGEGFFSIMKLLISDKIKTSIVVIRKELLAEFLSLLGSKPLIFEATISNRNDLPGVIFSYITSKQPVKLTDVDCA